MSKNRRRRHTRRISRLRKHWRRLTRGTTRTAGVAMCLMLFSAVVVGGSQVLPFASVHDVVGLDSDPAAAQRGSESSEVTVTRQLHRTDYNESWLQAGSDADRLGDIPRRHQARITPDGRLTGRIMTFMDWRGRRQPLANAPVHLVQHGRIAAATSTDADGRFRADRLKAGTYALLAQSPEGLLAYALHLRVADNEADAAEFQLHSVAATGWDAGAIVDRVNEYWQTQPPIERTREPRTDSIPEPVRPIEQDGVPATTLADHQVRLQDDGRLIGRMRRLHPDTGRPIIVQGVEVALFRNGSLQGITWTDEIGYFELPHVAPGVYSIVATGSFSTGPLPQNLTVSQRGLHHGFLTFGVKVLPNTASEILPVAFDETSLLEIDGALIDVADLLPFLDAIELPELSVTEMPFGNGGGTSGGGGGHLGELLIAGALAGLIPFVDRDDSSSASPNQP